MSDEPRKVPLRVRLPYGSEAEFATRYGAHVTRATLFLATRAPKPEGTALTFELVLSDGSRLMRGEGLVQSVTLDPAPGKSGMLVRLTRVDAHTKALIEQIVARRTGAAPAAAAPTAPEVAPLAGPPAATASGTFSVDDPLPAPPPMSAPPGLTRVRPLDRAAPLLETLPAPRPGGPGSSPSRPPLASSTSGLRRAPEGAEPPGRHAGEPPWSSGPSGAARAGSPGTAPPPLGPSSPSGLRRMPPGSSPSGLRRQGEPGGSTEAPAWGAPDAAQHPAPREPPLFPPYPASALDEPFGTRPGAPPLPFPTSALSGPDGLGPGVAPPAPDLPPLAPAGAPPVPLGSSASTPTLEVATPAAVRAILEAPGAEAAPAPPPPAPGTPAGAVELPAAPPAPEAAAAGSSAALDSPPAWPEGLPWAGPGTPEPAPTPGPELAAPDASLAPGPPLGEPAPAFPGAVPELALAPAPAESALPPAELLRASGQPLAVAPGATPDTVAPPLLPGVRGPGEDMPFNLEPEALAGLQPAGAGTRDPTDLSDVEALLPDFPATTPPGARVPSGPGAVRRTPVPGFPTATPSVPWSSFRPEPPERSTDSGSRRAGVNRPSGSLPPLPGSRLTPVPGSRLTPEPGKRLTPEPGKRLTPEPLAPPRPGRVPTESDLRPTPPVAGEEPSLAPPPAPARPPPAPGALPPRVAAASARTPAPAEARPATQPLALAASPGPATRPSGTRPLPSLEDEEVVIGVDLGTWVCRAAVHVRGVPQPVPILTEHNATSLPAAVGWDPDKGLVVGSAALALRSWRPELTVRGVKRLVGRRARPAPAREGRQRFPLELVPDAGGDVAVQLGERAFSVPELLGALLDALKTGAEAMVGRRVRKAVIGVPAWFTEHQRAQVLEGARAADLEVAALLNEPSAVALAFGAGRGLARKRLLVYDLGAGAFQVAVVEITGEDLEVVAVGADESLGGMDFDARLADALLGTVGTPERPATVTRAVLARVRDAAETAKRALDDQLLTRVVVPELGAGEDGLPRRLDVDVERAALERVSRELVERTMGVTRQVLDSARLTARSLDEVVLIGGQGHSAVVRIALQQLLGLPLSSFEAGHAVAIGAAHFGHSLALKRQGKRATSLSEVLAQPISVAIQGGGLTRVLDQNTRLPAEKSLQVPVRAGRPVAVPIFQGTSGRAEEGDYVGCARLSSPRDGELSVRFAVGADGRLSLTPVGPSAPGASLAFDSRLPSPEELASLLAQTPLPGRGAPAAPQGGLLGGLKRLFGK